MDAVSTGFTVAGTRAIAASIIRMPNGRGGASSRPGTARSSTLSLGSVAFRESMVSSYGGPPTHRNSYSLQVVWCTVSAATAAKTRCNSRGLPEKHEAPVVDAVTHQVRFYAGARACTTSPCVAHGVSLLARVSSAPRVRPRHCDFAVVSVLAHVGCRPGALV